jgi:hypothetical protein
MAKHLGQKPNDREQSMRRPKDADLPADCNKQPAGTAKPVELRMTDNEKRLYWAAKRESTLEQRENPEAHAAATKTADKLAKKERKRKRKQEKKEKQHCKKVHNTTQPRLVGRRWRF